ncbi:hypothetical protein P0E69_09495 [Chimaeribacter arupi]|uniref:hypothetical protein n=1 Tax=Chimaeribacter arupi TaxID=2060066 RepID=UPI002711EBE7|nr:hypothetical protein [Chimaeribacter arupi]WKZ94078.1 hypothetical protein P0E69_09495 [Chimaeribacter arupi]
MDEKIENKKFFEWFVHEYDGEASFEEVAPIWEAAWNAARQAGKQEDQLCCTITVAP